MNSLRLSRTCGIPGRRRIVVPSKSRWGIHVEQPHKSERSKTLAGTVLAQTRLAPILPDEDHRDLVALEDLSSASHDQGRNDLRLNDEQREGSHVRVGMCKPSLYHSLRDWEAPLMNASVILQISRSCSAGAFPR